ncbi:hypothetical protein ACHQM5_021999 [Ranunculus cassubicifolius]
MSSSSSSCRGFFPGSTAAAAAVLLQSHNNNSPLLWFGNNGNSSWRKKNKKSIAIKFNRISAAAAAGAGAPSPQYSEPLFGVGRKQRKRTVAGIDQDDLVDPSKLADADSSFLEFNGVHIHHKIYEHHHDQTSLTHTPSAHPQTTKIGFPIILLHGFGASFFSWHQTVKPLARATSSKVFAFDRPAFGLTSRSMVHRASASGEGDMLNPYSMTFSVLATLRFIDSLEADKAVLIGHSAGCAVAVNAYFKAPERVAAMILVAPAIMAPLAAPSKDTGKNHKEGESNNPDKKSTRNPLIMVGNMLSKLLSYIVHPILSVWKGMVEMISSLYMKALTAFLRSTVAVMLIRMVIDKFGITGIKKAWYDASKVSDHILDGYKKPLRTKDWERALLEFTVSTLTDSSSSGPPLSKRLPEISCPVLVVTGDSDLLTPAWNAERVSRVIPGCSLKVIKNCGHLPQEEKVEEFLSVVHDFLQRVFGAQEEPILQAAAFT